MTDIVKFLSKRLDEDEAAAHEDERAPGFWSRVFYPARVLAEVAAKRRLMARHFADQDGSCVGCGFGSTEERRVEDINDCPELRDMASVYDSHPDHKQEWKPIVEFVRREDYFSKPPALPPGWAIAPNRPKRKEST